MKYLPILLLWAAPTLADTSMSTPTMTGWQTKRGTYNVETPQTTKENCHARAKADAEKRKESANYSCTFVWKFRVEYKAPKLSLSWVAPATNTDGSPLTDLAGYRVRIGPTPGTYTQTIEATDTKAVIDVPPGAYYIAVFAVNAAGVESVASEEVSKVLR